MNEQYHACTYLNGLVTKTHNRRCEIIVDKEGFRVGIKSFRKELKRSSNRKKIIEQELFMTREMFRFFSSTIAKINTMDIDRMVELVYEK